MALYRCLRPLLFSMDPEFVHQATISLCSAIGRAGLAMFQPGSVVEDSRLAFNFAGLSFRNPVGLAAGFDKSGKAVVVLSRLGFGSIEIGSVSEHRSAGNAQRPRLWRLEADEGLRVFYGCPNDGAAAVAARLRGSQLSIPLGVNIAETNTGTVVAAEQAAAELARTAAQFAGIAGYLVLNLSCPNMPHGGHGLFDAPEQLDMLLKMCATHRDLPPVLLKLTPPGDPTDPNLIEPVLAVADGYPFVKGFILNIPNRSPYTTLRTPRTELDRMRGGITGPSLQEPTNAALAAWAARIDRSRHVLVGAGGIRNADDAYRMLRAGASWIQLYTALVYQGPGLVRTINEGLIQRFERDGVRHVSDVIGIDVSPRTKMLRTATA